MKILNTKPPRESLHVYAVGKAEDTRIGIRYFDLGYRPDHAYIGLDINEAKEFQTALNTALKRAEELALEKYETDDDE